MRLNSLKNIQVCLILGAALSLAPPARGQIFHRGDDHPTSPCPPAPECPEPGAPRPPAPTSTAPTAPTAPSVDLSALAPESSLALGGETVVFSAVGYIDSAIPRTLLRLRVDSAFDDNRPDRAEFFYAKCGCFRVAGLDPKAAGPGTVAENNVDFVEASSYLEVAVCNRISGFIEVPVRFIELGDNHSDFSGVGDLNLGFKAALLADQSQFLTFQFRTFIPTGEAGHGLGTNHVSLEPALLAYQRLTERLVFEGELRDWIPIGGSNFAGNVIRYGVGLSYDVFRSETLRISPVFEMVGWTVLSGGELAPSGPVGAAGDTIVNAKIGARLGFGEHSDLYFGYGRALTNDVWYKEVFRLEYRLLF